MDSLFRSVYSIFSQGVGLVSFHAARHAPEVIISGYSNSSCNVPWRPTGLDLDYRQVGILYADIVNYVRLSERDEEGTHLRLVEAMKLINAYVGSNDGRVAHFAGDGILVEFNDADSALQCAVNIQLAVQKRNAEIDLRKRISFRIGVHFGTVICDQGDIYGNAVNLAARLESLAGTGGICVSEAVRQRLKDHPGFKFLAMGKQYVKNISEPLDVFWIEMDARNVQDNDLADAMEVSAVAS